MIIYSMTAFAREQKQSDCYDFVCEMRSINHRYLEMSIHLPEHLRVFEMSIRERLRQQLRRGKIECVVRSRIISDKINQQYKINLALAQELCQQSEKITAFLPSFTPISPTDILRFPGVLEIEEMNVSAFQETVLQLIDATLKELVVSRSREGEELKRFFLQRLELMDAEVKKIRQRIPQILQSQRENLRERFQEAKLELNPERLEQELLLFAQRIDVAEEIERSETHITEIRRVLAQGGAVGRRLDFLLQELNREANTIGSKSVDGAITHEAVEMKVLIEQIREQVQNVE